MYRSKTTALVVCEYENMNSKNYANAEVGKMRKTEHKSRGTVYIMTQTTKTRVT